MGVEDEMDVRQFIININSEKPDELRAFYRDIVGLKPNPEMGVGKLWAGQTPFLVDSHSAVHGLAKEPARVLHNFFVDDLAAEQKRLEAAGVKFIRSAGEEPWGGVISTFVDPDGNYAQLISGPMKGDFYFVALHSDDADRLEHFYGDVLGLPHNPRMGGNMLMAAQTPVHIDGHSDVHGQTKEPERVLLNFFVDDVGTEQKRLEAAGVRFIRSGANEPWPISTFVDPDGNYGQLIEYKP
jgi:predicted enzyme related to lactoylglutathione lyase